MSDDYAKFGHTMIIAIPDGYNAQITTIKLTHDGEEIYNGRREIPADHLLPLLVQLLAAGRFIKQTEELEAPGWSTVYVASPGKSTKGEAK